eukprot:770784-Amorphochlora_amoeboformis.AAC.1
MNSRPGGARAVGVDFGIAGTDWAKYGFDRIRKIGIGGVLPDPVNRSGSSCHSPVIVAELFSSFVLGLGPHIWGQQDPVNRRSPSCHSSVIAAEVFSSLGMGHKPGNWSSPSCHRSVIVAEVFSSFEHCPYRCAIGSESVTWGAWLTATVTGRARAG